MVFKSFITTSAAVMAFVSGIAATMAPNYPQPGTVWTAGKQYQITWGKLSFLEGKKITKYPIGGKRNWTID